MKRFVIGFGWLVAACVAVAGTGTSNEFRVDTRTGDRVSAGLEELTFSNLWDGDANATVTIRQDGAAIFEGLSGEGVKTWTVDRNGRYELTHTTYTNGVAGKVETAVFVVEGKDVPVSELTIDWGQKSFVYDGQPKEPVIAVKDGATTLTKDTHYLVEYKDNVNVGTAKAIVKGLKPYVEEVTNTFIITAAPIGDDDDEPGPGVIPDGGLSKFDATYVYDGEGHTINTQALYAVTLTGSTPSFSFSMDGETGWQNDPFVYTNSGEYVVWYRIEAPNYNEFVHAAKIVITNVQLIVKSLKARQRYPWNGKIDIDYELTGAEVHRSYRLVFSAVDLVSGNKISVSSVSPNSVTEPSGRVVWNMSADCPPNFKSDHVKLEVGIEKEVK